MFPLSSRDVGAEGRFPPRRQIRAQGARQPLGAAVRAPVAARVAAARPRRRIPARFARRPVADAVGPRSLRAAGRLRAGRRRRPAACRARAVPFARRRRAPHRAGLGRAAPAGLVIRRHDHRQRRRSAHRCPLAGAPFAPCRGTVATQGRAAASAHRSPGSGGAARAARPRRHRPAGARRRQHLRPPALGLPFQLGHRPVGGASRRLGDAAIVYRQAAADAGRRRARTGIGGDADEGHRGAGAQRAHRAHQRARARRPLARRVRRGLYRTPARRGQEARGRQVLSPEQRHFRNPLRDAQLGGDPRARRRLGAGALVVLREARQGTGHCHDQAGGAHAARLDEAHLLGGG